jgi:hypothetical protein
MDEMILDAILGAGGVSETWELAVIFGSRQVDSSLKNLIASGLAEFSPCGRVYAVVPGNSGSDFDDVTEFSSVFNAVFTKAESPSRAA